nr:LYR motif-containing protein 2 isoform X1 [Microcebus murinus]
MPQLPRVTSGGRALCSAELWSSANVMTKGFEQVNLEKVLLLSLQLLEDQQPFFCLFMRRQQVLLLYRRILQAIRQVPNDSDRKYLKDWAREEFKRNKSATEEDTIRMMITQGNMQLKELEKTLALAKS